MVTKATGYIIGLCTVLVLAGCSSEPKGPPTSVAAQPVADESVFWSSIWSAEPGIDLFSREAELVRGTVEAGYLAQAYGVSQSFPGYHNALGGEKLPGDPRLREPINWAYAPPGRAPSPAESQKALYYHFVELKYLYVGVAVTLTNSADSPGRPGIVDDQKSTTTIGKIPTWDIFAPWRITQSHFIETESIPALCTDWWIAEFPDAIQDPGRNSVHLPRPAPAASDDVQYPKWLGPANSE
jgi:hypothetical protein